MKLILFLFTAFLFTHFLSAQCWRQISAGGDHSAAIKNDGIPWAWG